MKFEINVSPIVIAATSEEDAIVKLAAHLLTMSRHVASGRDVSSEHFSVRKASDDAEAADLTDKAFKQHGPVELDLDPESPAGKALEQQKAERKAEAEAAAAAKAKDSRSDAENLKLHAEAEAKSSS